MARAKASETEAGANSILWTHEDLPRKSQKSQNRYSPCTTPADSMSSDSAIFQIEKPNPVGCGLLVRPHPSALEPAIFPNARVRTRHPPDRNSGSTPRETP